MERPLTLRARVKNAQAEQASTGVTPPQEPTSYNEDSKEQTPAREPFRLQFDVLRSAEFWLNKVGIVLFLFGVIFLFRYAMDRQWLNEQARVGAGLLLGSILLGFGLRLHEQRRHLAQVLLGGSVATYYITGYAAYNLFPSLQVPYATALGYMLVITLLAFVLSVWRSALPLAIIGVTGGLLSPFALSFSTVQVPGLIMYSSLIVAGTSAIYLMRGWRSLLWCTCNAGLAVLMVAQGISLSKWGYSWPVPHPAAMLDRAYLQGGIIVGLLAFWLVPVAHQVLWRKNPARWQRPALDVGRYPVLHKLGDMHVHLLAALVPPVCLLWSWEIWFVNWGGGPGVKYWDAWGLLSLLGAAVMLGAFLVLRRAERGLAYTHALLGVGLVTLGLVQLLEGNLLFLALAVEGLALLLVAWRYSDRGMELCGHALFTAAGVWLIPRLTAVLGDAAPFFNVRALFDLAVLGLALLASFVVARQETRLVYRSLFHLAVIAWLWRELHTLPNGEGLMMLAWGGYALLLHAVARRIPDQVSATGTTVAAHFALDAALGVLAFRLATGLEGANPILNEKAGIDLLFMGLAFGVSFLVKQQGIASAYRAIVHAAALGWLWRESTVFDMDQGYLMLRWALYLGMLALVSHKVRDTVMLWFVNWAWVPIAYMLAMRFQSVRWSGPPFLNADAIVDAAVIAIAFAVQMVAQPRWAVFVFRIAGHAGVLCLLWRELWTLPQGDGIVMVAGAAYLVGVLLLSRELADVATAQSANIAFAGVGMLLLARLMGQPEGLAFANWTLLLDVATIALAVGASFLCRPSEAALGYRLVSHFAVLLLFYRELHGLEYGFDMVILAWTAYAACLYFLGRRVRDEATLLSGYAIFGAAGAWLLSKIVFGLLAVNPDAPAVLTVRGLADLAVIALGVAVYLFPAVRNSRIRLAHGLWLHLTFLGWMWQELGLLESGNAYVTIAWGIYGISVVIAGFVMDRNLPVMLCGITTLFAIAGKLFVIDLQYLGTIWQIMLFLGFGGFFLVVSYGFQKYVLGKGEAPGQRQGPAVGETTPRQAPEKG
ncbi:MAG: DUF2339 domain-containing protein [Chloroflexota bacterium]|nr:DUF2339 domain-containing protein [Chloroflexota bacterium]MDQ5865895.1 DUF2339 domain-containing protein [Chloroflexota bacterium]